MLDIAQDKLRRGGWAPYYLYRQKFMSGGFENVGWSKPGSENIYNVCIMEELCTIIALGGGGSTKLIPSLPAGATSASSRSEVPGVNTQPASAIPAAGKAGYTRLL